MYRKRVLFVMALVVAWVLGSVLAAAVGAVVVPEEVTEHNLVVVSTDVEGPRYVWWIVGPRGLEEFKPCGIPDAGIISE